MDFSFMHYYLAKPQESLEEHTEKLIAHANTLWEMRYISQENVWQNLLCACRYHDIGKMNEEFQKRIKSMSRFDPVKEVGHNLISGFLVDLEGKLAEDDYYKVIYVVINHHHYHMDNFAAIENSKELILKQVESIKERLRYHGISMTRPLLSRRAMIKVKASSNNPETRLLKGFLHKCDYAASSGIEVEYPNDFLETSLQEYYKRKKFELNSMQQFCVENREENVLLTAPTGMGKTEAALFWLGNTKGLYILPLKTAINEIYKRIRDEVLLKKNIDKRLGLLYSETFSAYMNGSGQNTEQIEETEYQKVKYYFEETRNLSLPITVSTPDQIFNFVFRYDGYELKLANLSYSKVIIDEIQSYGADLLAYLIFGLQSIVEVGGKFAIFTATFPPFIKDLLAMDFKCGQEQTASNIIRVEEIKDESFVHEKNRHFIRIKETQLNTDDIKDIYKKDENKKILVICNTVKQAQNVFKELSKDCNCEMLHAKFIYKDRVAKESHIMEDGRTYKIGTCNLHDKKIIWIATQIVEASLDIDFDYLFTEVTDLNSLFQRLGRANRKGVKLLEEANCFVYTKVEESLFLRSNRGFIDEDLHKLSEIALLEIGEGIISEQKKQDLIAKYFTYAKIKEHGSEFLKQYEYYYRKVSEGYSGHLHINDVKSSFRNIISYKSIPRVVYEKQYSKELNLIQNVLKDTDRKIQECYCSKKKVPLNLRLEKVKWQQELNRYCFSDNFYGIEREEKIKFGDEEIYIVDGDYSFEIGFERAKKEVKPEKNVYF